MTANPVPVTGESQRKAALAALLLRYSAVHGLCGMSLRPAAAAVGSSPRMLLYFFGSKEGLIREVLSMSRAAQMTLVTQSLHESRQAEADPVTRLWQWLTEPANANMERLFFESYGRSLTDRDGPWTGFGADSVADWLPFITKTLDHAPDQAGRDTGAIATFVLAVLRGLLLDLLATSDTERVTHALTLLGPAIAASRARSAGS